MSEARTESKPRMRPRRQGDDDLSGKPKRSRLVVLVGVAMLLIIGWLMLSGRPSERATPAPQHDETADEVEDAYLRAWEAQKHAMMTLDPAGLDEVFAEQALDVVVAVVERRRQLNQPLELRVTHGYTIEMADEITAVVDDVYRNSSAAVGVQAAEETLHDRYTLRQGDDGVWRVIHTQRLQEGQ